MISSGVEELLLDAEETTGDGDDDATTEELDDDDPVDEGAAANGTIQYKRYITRWVSLATNLLRTKNLTGTHTK